MTAGTCQVTDFNIATKTVKVLWNLPTEAGEHQLSVNAGNKHQYATASDQVLVH